MDYAAMYRQAMADGATDYAQTIVVSASQAAQAGALSPEELTALVAEVKAHEGV
ncbi:hypothetical protein PV733_28185 [Streptomyces europaeiscabiei]|uniref:hypothetical protein n=1 Tax=Streptomyces europaeiscabiei TaxID=146819 RepID=UPI0029A786AF|nr:hypothetical protein [Streptomyces europaeiscabiei]MDX3712750.1 hypothetical protein [Streptomyces europaeiscabiei]